MKNGALIFVFCFSFMNSSAQVIFGVKAGLNISNLYASNEAAGFFENNENRPAIGFHAGVSGRVNLNKHIVFISEIQYSKRGALYQSNSENNERIIHHTLEVPLLLSIPVAKLFYLDLGPSLGYTFTSSLKQENGVSRSFFSSNRFDLAFSGGMRVNISESIWLIGRYNYGLTPIDKMSVVEMANPQPQIGKFYDRNAQLGVCYQFN